MSKFLGIDASTQSITATIVDADTGAIELEKSLAFDDFFAASYGVDHGVVERGNGEVHSFPLMWAEALDLLLETLRDAGADLGAVAALAGSGQQHGTVYLNDKAPEVLGRLQADHCLAHQLEGIFSRGSSPIWMDSSTTNQCEEIQANLGGADVLLRLTGNTAFERFSGPQIRKFSQTEPENYRRTHQICLVSSYMASLLAGRLVPIDAGDGSGTNLMDISKRQWSPEAMAATAPDLDRKLAPVIRSDEIVGTISPYYVQRYGFSADCRVLPFSGDNPCSLIGMGLVVPGKVALSLGTSDTLFACMGVPLTSKKGEGSVFASPDGANYMALICFMNGSLAREAVRDQYGMDWRGFEEALSSTEAGNGGGLMLPYFGPEIVPKKSRPNVVRENLDATEPARNVRAVIEAQAISSVIHSRWMGVLISSLYVTGGASRNSAILQTYADVHSCPVHRFETANSAGLGAALRANYSYRTQVESGVDWEAVVEPFTRPIPDSTILPRPGSGSVYGPLIESYERLESKHV